MYGWTGKLLRIDVGKRTYSVEDISKEILHTYIGGKGLAGYYLKSKAQLSWDSPDMPLLLFTGPLVGTTSPTSGRMTIMSRSPLTGTVGDTSVGGKLGTQLKKAGYDGLIITGKADSWCGIELSDSEVVFKDASSMIDMETSEISSQFSKKSSIAAIGPAAHHGVMYSSIIIDKHFTAGRNGLGLSFAVKKLKYVAVTGTGKVSVYDQEALKEAREEIFRLAAASPILFGEHGISNFGTGALYDLMDSRRMMPTANFRKTNFPVASQMNAVKYSDKYHTKKVGCRGCHILCKKQTDDHRAVPEFETMSHFSALLENEDMETVVEANRICNELGMDTISTAATISCYAEINDLKLSSEEILELLKKIGNAEGIGKELAMGSKHYADSKGRPETAIVVKSQELPAYDPRGAYGMALAYATSTRGGCHLRAYPISHEILRKPVATDRFSFSGKARIIKIAEDLNAVIDSLTACKFIFFASSLEEFAYAFTAVTGVETTAQDLLKAGERIYNNERHINSLNGFTIDDDDLPERFFTESGSSGNGIEVKPIPRDEFLAARAAYYKIRGVES